MIDASGSVYPVGDIASGAHVPIPTASVMTLGVPPPGTTAEDQEQALARYLGLDARGAASFVGLVQLVGRQLVTGQMPVLLAQAERPSAGTLADVFRPEHELHLVRVVPDADVEVTK
jgi:hypothetical protein